MIGHEGTQFVRTVRQGQKHIRHEPGLFLHRQDHLPEVVRQVV